MEEPKKRKKRKKKVEEPAPKPQFKGYQYIQCGLFDTPEYLQHPLLRLMSELYAVFPEDIENEVLADAKKSGKNYKQLMLVRCLKTFKLNKPEIDKILEKVDNFVRPPQPTLYYRTVIKE